MATEHQIALPVRLFPEGFQELDRAGSLGQQPYRLHHQLVSHRERVDRLLAADCDRGPDTSDRKVGEVGDQALGLLMSLLAEGPLEVVTIEAGAITGVSVSDQVQSHSGRGS